MQESVDKFNNRYERVYWCCFEYPIRNDPVVLLEFGFLFLQEAVDNNRCEHVYIQTIAFEVSFNVNIQSQSNWSLFNGTRQKRRRELDNRLSFEIGEMTLQMQ